MSREKEIAQLKTTLTLDAGDFKKQLSNTSKETNNLKRSFDIANKSIENAEDSIEATNKAISRGEKAMDSMNKKLDLQKKRYDDLKSTIDRQSKSYNELSDKLNKAEKELEEMEKAENKNTEAIEKQKKSIDDLKKKLSDKAQLIEKNINTLQKYSNDIDKTENDITGLGNQLGKLKSSLEDVAESTESAFTDNSASNLDRFKDLANEAGVNLDFLELSAKGAAAALAVVITKSVIDGAESYDKAITDLQISMGITEESAKDLYKTINDIADGGYSIEGVADAVKMLEQRFGLSAEESEELAQGIDLLNKYGYENKDVIRFMTSAVNDWGMGYEEALDYILKGHQEGLNMSEDWMDTLVEYSPIFSTLGVTSQDAFLLIQEGFKATGVDTDKAADMVKEFFLKFTEGSDSTKEVFDNLGLNLEELQKQVDDGSITSVDAMKKVMQAIMDVGSETEQSRILQELFGGTVEYGSIGIVEAWANVGNEVVNTTGTIDAAKEAFEGSYEAAKQDLSNSWNQLKETIGSGVVPALTWVVDILNIICESVPGVGTLVKNMFAEMGNDISQWTLGAVGKLQEFEIACIEGAIKIAEALGKDEWVTKLEGNLDRAKKYHSDTVNKIIENENERTRIQNESQAIRDQIFNRDKENHNNSADAIIKKNKEVSESSGSTNKKLQSDSNTTASTVSKNTSKINKDISSNLNSAKSSAESSMTGVKGAVDSNMDGSLRTVQVQATEMYKGVKTSFHKMSQSAHEDGTEMYKGVQTSANKMASSAKAAATDMYKGVTTSTSRMAQKAIADWNSIRNAFSRSISGTITTYKKTVTQAETMDLNEKNIDLVNTPQTYDFDVPNITPYITRGSYFQMEKNSNLSKSFTNNNSKLDVLLNQISNLIKGDNNVNLTLTIPVNLDGREITKVVSKNLAFNTRRL